MSDLPFLELDRVRVSLHNRAGTVAALNGIELSVGRGEILGLVGESGGGKSMMAQTIAGMLPDGAQLSGRVAVQGRDIVDCEEAAMHGHRGGGAAICFQNPRGALSPTRRVGKQLVDRLVRWQGLERNAAWEAARRIFAEVGIRDPERRLRAFPHELSGGMCQRVMIALALACRPKILLADEPTTGLDSTLSRDILQLFRTAAQRERCAVIIVSHDIASIAKVCDRIAVLYAGVLVESGPTQAIISEPRHPYTRTLLDAVPDLDGRMPDAVPGTMPRLDAPPASCPFADRCALVESICRRELPAWEWDGSGRGVRCFRAGKSPSASPARAPAGPNRPSPPDDPVVKLEQVKVRYAGQYGRQDSLALRGVSLELRRAETLGVVGESGCGKSTLARAIMGLVTPESGSVVVNGRDYARTSSRDMRALRRDIQMVFQDPVDSLSPRMTVEQNVRDPLRAHGGRSRKQDALVAEILSRVGLGAEFRKLYPSQLSGGQAQRVAIARALIVDPLLIVFDEPTSALDVTIQAQILDLLRELMAEGRRSYVFVSHDLATVRGLCDRVAVLYLGKIVELGTAAEVLTRPRHPYTQALVESSPSLTGQEAVSGTRLRRDLDEAYEVAGCALAPRCPYAESTCEQPQTLEELDDLHFVACWKAGGGKRRLEAGP